MRTSNYYLIIFTVIQIVVIYYLYVLLQEKRERYNTEMLTRLESTFTSVIDGFEMVNESFFFTQGDTLAKIIAKVDTDSTQERDAIRNELLQNYASFYNNQKLGSMSVFQIFDKKGRSLLRFHELAKHDDFIIKKRFSLQKLFKNFRYQKGLELGVYKEAYRFQYPLFYDGAFVGAYEYGISIEAILKKIKELYICENLFLLRGDAIETTLDPKVIHSQYHLFTISKEPFYYNALLKHEKFNSTHFKYVRSSIEFQKAPLYNEAKVANYYFHGDFFSVIYTPVFDIEGKKIALLLSFVENSPFAILLKTFIFELILSFVLLFSFYYFTIKQLRNKIYTRNLLNLQHDMLIVTNGERIEDANDAMLQFFGYQDLQEFLKNHACICDFFLPQEGYLQKKMGTMTWLEYIKKNPQLKHYAKMQGLTGARVFDIRVKAFKHSHLFVSTFRDVTQEIQEKKELENRANFDTLTGIYARERFEFFLHQEIKEAMRYKRVFSLIMFDIDHFKEINDTYGHDVGDSVLKELTSIVNKDIRDIDTFARWGGEEFMIITHTNITQSETFAQKLRKKIESHSFAHIKTLTCSFGVSSYKDGDTAESIVKHTDEMLYKAKNSGRNCVVADKQ